MKLKIPYYRQTRTGDLVLEEQRLDPTKNSSFYIVYTEDRNIWFAGEADGKEYPPPNDNCYETAEFLINIGTGDNNRMEEKEKLKTGLLTGEALINFINKSEALFYSTHHRTYCDWMREEVRRAMKYIEEKIKDSE